MVTRAPIRHVAVVSVAAALALSTTVASAQGAPDEARQTLRQVVEAGRHLERTTRATAARCPTYCRALRASFAALLREARVRAARADAAPSTGDVRGAALRGLVELRDRADALAARASDCGELEALTAAVSEPSARDALVHGGLAAGQERDLALASRDPSALSASRALWSDLPAGVWVAWPRGRVEVLGLTTEPRGYETPVARTLQGALLAMQQCYDRGLRNVPLLAGEGALRFTLDADGRVRDSDFEGLAGLSDVGRCVAEAPRRRVFVSPPTPVEVRATLRFTSPPPASPRR